MTVRARILSAVAVVLVALAVSPPARAGTVTVPFDVGIGPAGHLITGPMMRDQTLFWGLRISTYAIIDRRTIHKYARRIPPQYRRMAMQTKEARFRPSELAAIPATIYISPAYRNTGMYGLTLRPLAGGFGIRGSGFRLGVDFGLLLTYAYIHSTTLPSPTHFLRPGLEGKLELEIPITRDFLISMGWASDLYPPQPLGGAPWKFTPFDQSIWHIGQAFFLFHVRFPVTTSL